MWCGSINQTNLFLAKLLWSWAKFSGWTLSFAKSCVLCKPNFQSEAVTSLRQMEQSWLTGLPDILGLPLLSTYSGTLCRSTERAGQLSPAFLSHCSATPDKYVWITSLTTYSFSSISSPLFPSLLFVHSLLPTPLLPLPCSPSLLCLLVFVLFHIPFYQQHEALLRIWHNFEKV